MRIINVVFAGALAAAAMLTAPAQARNSDAQNGEDKASSSSCSAYQQTPDGSWAQLPCKETGERNPSQTQHRPPAHGTDRDER
ncbi:hypothetical protein FXV83_18630 [Bradyrhizobium hipponense]|uniref:Uncharacterized protein n=1 Tax=Bradyrhizobium hipponense TaxID=2605638 RepID=A0A5S4YN45_9BRAD|nr:hypothetical protein [Bradyrhizobium hipponense]TYO65084.1 hypothetical protein FXV83_18630 [Bradyrhizobium hipponense]